ncbi:MAG TPA: ABC transporter permease [Elusimicrobiota bacterium]|jgi:lipopolysaccharide transport system permease protein|nr:ABC transporter permease [Elusimicrobiota bacterium]
MRLHLERLLAMSWCEWRLREQSSLFGFFWTLLHPLMLFLVLLVVFTRWLGSKSPDYPGLLLVGLVHYNYFSTATSYACTSLRRRRGMVLNFPIPRELIVLASVLSVAVSYLLELVVLGVVLTCLGYPPAPSWLAMPLIAAVLILGVAGVALPLATIGARYPDFERVWAIVVQAGFFLTPVFYRISDVSPSQRALLELNPLARLIETARVSLVYGRFPSWTGAALGLAVAAAIATGGWLYFRTQARRLADDVAV